MEESPPSTDVLLDRVEGEILFTKASALRKECNLFNYIESGERVEDFDVKVIRGKILIKDSKKKRYGSYI